MEARLIRIGEVANKQELWGFLVVSKAIEDANPSWELVVMLTDKKGSPIEGIHDLRQSALDVFDKSYYIGLFRVD